MTFALAVPAIPLVMYILGLQIPKDHYVSRTVTFSETSAQKVWKVLTDVQQYPSWQPALDRVEFVERKDDRTVFKEHTKRASRVTVVNVELVPERALVRVIPNQNEQQHQHNTTVARQPTFVGTWSFRIVEEEGGKVTVRITEQGSITKPMVRLLHALVFGHHRRLDRFIRDLSRKIQDDTGAPLPDNLLTTEVQVDNDESPSSSSSPSMHSDKDWDMISEIYEHHSTSAAHA